MSHTFVHTADHATASRQARRRWAVYRDGAALAVAGGLVFQALHALEHLVQLAMWLVHPLAPPYLTPWAIVGRDGLAMVAGSTGAGGEVLHLIGNLIFLAALLGLRLVDATDARLGVRPPSLSRERAAKGATVMQTVHVMEHLMLTAAVVLTGTPLGMSTLFGLLEAGTPSATALRVLFHFTLNAVPTILVGKALWTTAPWNTRRPRPVGRPTPHPDLVDQARMCAECTIVSGRMAGAARPETQVG